MINPTPFGFRSCRQLGFEVCSFTGIESEYRFGKLMCISDQPNQLQKFAKAASDHNLEGVYSLNTVYELTPKSVDKGIGLQKLFEAMKLKPDLFIAAGDGENDLALFRIADITFAPSTSPDIIRRNADQITDWENSGILEPILKKLQLHIYDQSGNMA